MHNSMVIAAPHASASAAQSRLAFWIKGLVGIFGAAVAVHQQRRELRELDDRMLADIGLSRHDVHREGTRSFFDIP